MTGKYIKHGDILEHRMVMEEHIGRKLGPNEVVHHINGDKSDNRIENLRIMTNSEHSSLHSKKPGEVELICPSCGRKFKKSLREYNRNIKEGRKSYCSKKCNGKDSKSKFKYNEDIDELIIKGLKDNLSGYKIAEKYGLNKKTVYNHIKSLNREVQYI